MNTTPASYTPTYPTWTTSSTRTWRSTRSPTKHIYLWHWRSCRDQKRSKCTASSPPPSPYPSSRHPKPSTTTSRVWKSPIYYHMNSSKTQSLRQVWFIIINSQVAKLWSGCPFITETKPFRESWIMRSARTFWGNTMTGSKNGIRIGRSMAWRHFCKPKRGLLRSIRSSHISNRTSKPF